MPFACCILASKLPWRVRQCARDGAQSQTSLMLLASLTLHTAYVRRSEGIVQYVYRTMFTGTRAYCTFPWLLALVLDVAGRSSSSMDGSAPISLLVGSAKIW